MVNNQQFSIQAIVGLGNPGQKFKYTRHNIGFLVVDALAEKHAGSWQEKDLMASAQIMLGDKQILLIKPQTYMNNSGKAIPFLTKKGMMPENILVVHDELEAPVGKIKIRSRGSAKGHNGLRSIIEQIGDGFPRLSCGIGRPERKEDVSNYVLERLPLSTQELDHYLDQIIKTIEQLCSK